MQRGHSVLRTRLMPVRRINLRCMTAKLGDFTEEARRVHSLRHGPHSNILEVQGCGTQRRFVDLKTARRSCPCETSHPLLRPASGFTAQHFLKISRVIVSIHRTSCHCSRVAMSWRTELMISRLLAQALLTFQIYFEWSLRRKNRSAVGAADGIRRNPERHVTHSPFWKPLDRRMRQYHPFGFHQNLPP